VGRLFLDANVLFSAAYRRDSGLRRLWDMAGAVLVTSEHAIDEAMRNLEHHDQRAELQILVAEIEIVGSLEPDTGEIGNELPDKDRPIIRAAMLVRATHLTTGDTRHFGAFFGKKLHGVLVLPPAEYFRSS
jgi:predicted nucleic acid-binding protein